MAGQRKTSVFYIAINEPGKVTFYETEVGNEQLTNKGTREIAALDKRTAVV